MIGRTLSHYRILGKIAEGGMGVVYKAQDLHLDRFVAVKTLPKEKVADPERRRRFIQEARSASALNHPNIITIHDIDEADGVYFIAMEYLPGKTLHEMIEGREIRLEQSLDYAIQIGDALTKAHSAGIVHRDIKPSNVMITDENLAKVLDFGLAKLAGPAEEWLEIGPEDRTPSLGDITRSGMILGTLSYMSPEQARGREVDHRTDIFSLGIMLYQMVAGELPFRGPNAAAVLDKLLHEPTPSIRSTNSNLPAALEQSVGHATAKDPEDRYQSMQEMVSDLRSIRSLGKLARTLPRKRGWRSAALAVAAIVLVLLLALPFREQLSTWLAGKAVKDEIVLAILPIDNLNKDEENQAFCEGFVERLITKFVLLARLGKSLSVISSSDVRAEGITSAAAARRTFEATFVLTGSLQRLLDKVSLSMHLVDAEDAKVRDSRTWEVADSDLPELEEYVFADIAEMLALQVNPQEWQVLSAGNTNDPEAYNSYLIGLSLMARFDIAENIDDAIMHFRQSIAKDPRHARAHAALGEACWRKWGLSEDRQWVDEALSHCEQAIEIDTRIADVYLTQGIIYIGTGQAEKAVEALNQVIKLEPENAKAHCELANAYERAGKIGEAEAAYRKAIEIKPDDWYNHFCFGRFYYNRSLYSESAAAFKKVIELEPDHFYSYSALGAVYTLQGDFEKAEEMYAKSLAIRETPEAYNNLASSYIFQGRAPEAVPLMERAVEMEGASHEMWASLGDAYTLTPGSTDRAPAAFRRAVDMVSEDLEVNPNDRESEVGLAYYLIRLGDKRQALEIVDRIIDSASASSSILFWAALVYERADDRERALTTLAAAAKAGYSTAVIEAASDLEDLRKDPRYRDLIDDRAVR